MPSPFLFLFRKRAAIQTYAENTLLEQPLFKKLLFGIEKRVPADKELLLA